MFDLLQASHNTYTFDSREGPPLVTDICDQNIFHCPIKCLPHI
jgi:hypothetical protein